MVSPTLQDARVVAGRALAAILDATGQAVSRIISSCSLTAAAVIQVALVALLAYHYRGTWLQWPVAVLLFAVAINGTLPPGKGRGALIQSAFTLLKLK